MANIIFDFDGTIADSLPVVVDMLNGWMTHRGPVGDKELQKLRNMHIRQILEELSIPLWRVPNLLVEGRQEMSKHIDDVKVVAGVPEVISMLKADDHTLYIMSSNSADNIRKFLKKHKLSKNFKRIYGGIGLFSKANALKKVVRDNNLSKDNTLYIGDEVRDVHAGHKAQIRVISVGWGYNGQKILRSAEPMAIATTPGQLPALISL